MPSFKGIDIERIKENIKIDHNGCWIWQKCIANNGYGQVRVKNITYSVHRLSYEFMHGKIKKGFHILHKCDIRSCVNPDHLITGTNLDNIKDMFKKGRNPSRKGELQGRSILKEIDVKNLRAIKKFMPEVKFKRLSELYCLNISTIRHAVLGTNWRHI